MLKEAEKNRQDEGVQRNSERLGQGQGMTQCRDNYPKMKWTQNGLASMRYPQSVVIRIYVRLQNQVKEAVELHVLPKLFRSLHACLFYTGPLRDYMKNILQPHKLVPIRQRYFYTSANKLRLRYLTGTAACVLTGFATLFGATSHSWALRWDSESTFSSAEIVSAPSVSQREEEQKLAALVVPEDLVEESINTEIEAEKEPSEQTLASIEPIKNPISEVVKSKVSDGIRQASAALKKSENPLHKALKVGNGDTVAGVLGRAGIDGPDAYKLVQAIGKHYDLRKVRPGQVIDVHYSPETESTPYEFSKLVMDISPQKEVTITRNGDDYKSQVAEKAIIQRSYAGRTEIQTSLYGSAARAGIPSQVIAEVIRVYSWDVDFQRDIRPGDKIEVMYETVETEDGDFVKYGDILYANLSVRGKDMPIYRYEFEDGRTDYFEPNGRSIRKTLLTTPVDGARMSSGFGMRKHPILGYNKMHKGVDFAAPTGTPIYAAGDGVIDYVGRKGGYGNYVRIRHNGTMKTAYAHMHRYAKGLKKGKAVEQGDVIGYVGSSGRSTGPHLHYEVLLNNKQVNPRRIDLPTGEILKGNKFDKFKVHMNSLHQQYVGLTDGLEFAMHDDTDANQIR